MQPSWQNWIERFAHGTGSVDLQGLPPGALSYFVALGIRHSKRPAWVLCATNERAQTFYDDLNFFLALTGANAPQTDLWLGPEPSPYERLGPDSFQLGTRLRSLYNLEKSARTVGVISLSAWVQNVAPPAFVARDALLLKVDDECGRDDFLQRLVHLGYQRVHKVEDVAQFSGRGDIVDFWSPGEENPIRSEWWSDTVEQLRHFDPETQRTFDELRSAVVLPVGELALGSILADELSAVRDAGDKLNLRSTRVQEIVEQLQSGDLYPWVDKLAPVWCRQRKPGYAWLPDDAVLIVDQPGGLADAADELQQQWQAAFEIAQSRDEIIFPVTETGSWPDFKTAPPQLGPRSLTLRGSGAGVVLDAAPADKWIFDCRPTAALRQRVLDAASSPTPMRPLVDQIRAWRDEGHLVVLAVESAARQQRVVDLLYPYNLRMQLTSDVSQATRKDVDLWLTTGALHGGFTSPTLQLTVIPEAEVFGQRYRVSKRRRRMPTGAAADFMEWKAGDYLVHREHGIAIFKGLTKLPDTGLDTDFVLLEYRDEEKLYLPVYRLAELQKYAGAEGAAVRLDKIGGETWAKTKQKVGDAVLRLSRELLETQAQRQLTRGFKFSAPDEHDRAFAAGFPHAETPDQERAIDEVLHDMGSERPMDRLVCGDVGYGKTEVAMRAAYRTVLDKKQVAILVPTTILAEQHFQTFSSRFDGTGVVVDVLHRFRTRVEQQKVFARLAAGKVDVVIGTHVLLGRETAFKDLGLLVIDEEHRFGVGQKEKLKSLKSHVDVLTLTATPIPRTLQMAMSGIREMSLIATPPVDRLAVRTHVAFFDESLVQEAIERELARQGQVFFVHNLIESLARVDELVARLCPRARRAMAHGQMREEQLEQAMLGFSRGEVDVLICTAIIESGLDFSNANTILIDRADHFGLAQLYQLRGRVGRARRRAYAYLLLPREKKITREASQRLEAIERLGDLGVGFQLASYDLEIRGAGNLLGDAQSGQIAAVGLDTYLELLQQTMAELQGKPRVVEPEPEIRVRCQAFIPEGYVPDIAERLSFYRRLARAETEAALTEIGLELEDRFGAAPDPLQVLLHLMRLKNLAKRLGISAVDSGPVHLSFGFRAQSRVAPDWLVRLVQAQPQRYRLTPQLKWLVRMTANEARDPLQAAEKLLQEMETRVIQ